MVSLQGHPQSGSDIGRPPEKDPQQHPVYESPDEPDHFRGGVIPRRKRVLFTLENPAGTNPAFSWNL